jgi:hypothetical protein
MFEDSRTVAIKVRIERYSVANIPEQARPLLRHSREDNGEAEDEPGQRDEFGECITSGHMFPSEAFPSRCDTSVDRASLH